MDIPQKVRWAASKPESSATQDKVGRKKKDPNESMAQLVHENGTGRMYITYTSPYDPLAKVTFTIEITHLILDIIKSQQPN